MVETKLLYQENFTLLQCRAKVVFVSSECIVLDQTIFYPQGGGQPCDQGTIFKGSTIFTVADVRFVNGEVKHFGSFLGPMFEIEDEITCQIDEKRRCINSKVHSAGHLIDKAIAFLKLSLEPSKGYHFKEGPYVEYIGDLSLIDKDKLKMDLEKICNDWIQEGMAVKSLSMEKEELKSCCLFVPDYLPENKPLRVVFLGDFPSPCGGTHVSNISEIKKIVIRKIKETNGTIRISYLVND